MKYIYNINKTKKFLLTVVCISLGTYSWGQTILTGGNTGTSKDKFIINSDESENDAGIRLQTRSGNSHTDWNIWAENESGSLRFSSWYSNDGHSDADENKAGDSHVVISKEGTMTVLNNLIVGSDVIASTGTFNVYGRTHIFPKLEGPTYNIPDTGDNSHYNLWVEQGIISSNLALINVENWPDYVFKKDYPLRDLESLEKFIKKNGHLPNIPSEKEILENGYSQHDMNVRFLEKIEELTLYSIDQNKKINALIKELELQDSIQQNTLIRK